MKQQWQSYSEKFVNLSTREQYLIIATGLVAITFTLFSFFIDKTLINNKKLSKQINATIASNQSSQTTIRVLEESLLVDPNIAIHEQISRYKDKVSQVDQELLKLTSGLINPVQMRYALIELLTLDAGVNLLSFEVIKAEPLTTNKQASKNAKQESQNNQEELTLYKHGIKLKLQGKFFQLRDYLTQLESLQWKFFWQSFDYQLVEYPNSELTIELYSLSTNEEFIGV